MKKFCEYIKKIIIKKCILIIEKLGNLELYNEGNIQKSGVYWCTMPLEEQELMQVAPGHRIRPFVIFKVERNGCWGYSCSSKGNETNGKSLQFFINKDKYSLQKNSYVDTSKTWYIPYENMHSHFYQLNKEDFQAIVQFSKIKNYKKTKNEIGVGSIVEKNLLYYLICAVKNGCYLAYPLYSAKDNTRNKTLQTFAFNGKVYYFNYEHQVTINDIENYSLEAYLSNVQKKELTKKEKEVKNHEKQIKGIYEYLEDLSFQYEVGTLFYEPYQDEKFIYLFHRKNRCYGVFMSETNEFEFILRKVKVEFLRESKEQISENELLFILQSLELDHANQEVINHILDLKTQAENSELCNC